MMKTLHSLAASAFALMLAGTAAAGDLNYTFGYCNDVTPEAGVGAKGANLYLCGAIKIPKEQLQAWGMDGVRSIQFYKAEGQCTDGTVFISSNLNAAPAYTQSCTARTGWNVVDFDQVQAWDPANDLYVGWYIKTLTNQDFVLTCDGAADVNPNACWLSVTDSEKSIWGAFTDYKDQGFGNLMIRATMTGTAFPTNSMAIANVEYPSSMRPNVPFEAKLNLVNDGANDVNSCTVEYSLGAGEILTQTFTFDSPVTNGSGVSVALPMVTDEDSFQLPVFISVTTVNDQPVTPAPTYEGAIMCSDNAFTRTTVIEEGTGTWCGWCVRGYYGMEYMKEKYEKDGDYIGIAVHQGDAMAINAYQGFINKYISGFPNAMVNRRVATDPSWQYLEQYFLQARGETDKGISLVATLDGNEDDGYVIDATATARFGVGKEKAKYSMTFVQVEDNVGPYQQANYYSGQPDAPEAPGFGKEGSYVSLKFNDVPVDVSGWSGISKSLPTTIEAGKDYSYSKKMNAKFHDNEYGRLVALLLDTSSGEIINAAQVRFGTIGVGNINNDDAEVYAKAVAGGVDVIGCKDAKAYDLNGRLCGVAQDGHIALPAGFYVVALGQKAVKVVVK